MSAPNTNVEKQEKRHKSALLGIKGSLIFGVLMILLVMFFVLDNGRSSDGEAGLNPEDNATPEVTPEVTAPVDPVKPGTNESN